MLARGGLNSDVSHHNEVTHVQVSNPCLPFPGDEPVEQKECEECDYEKCVILLVEQTIFSTRSAGDRH
jgi:hypothetical protein